MKMYLLRAGLLLALAAILVTLPGSRAADSPAKSKEEKSAEAVNSIAAAYRMADAARESKSPEMLIGAAKLLRSISAKPGDVETTTEKGEKVKGGEAEPLQKIAAAWLKEAGAMAPKDELIQKLVSRLLDTEEQGSLGGPRSYFHRPGVGQTINWNVTFAGGQPASVSVTGNGRNRLTLTVTGPQGHYYTWTGGNPSVNWVPDRTKTYTITVRNDGPGEAAYTLYHN
jgi:hypothetical protein